MISEFIEESVLQDKRKIGFWVLIAVCVLALPGGFLYWWHQANVNPVVHIPSVKLPKPNAYDYYAKAAGLLKDSRMLRYAADSQKKPNDLPDPRNKDDRYYSLADKEALLRKNGPAFRQLREGLKYTYGCLPVTDPKVQKNHVFDYIYFAPLFQLESEVRLAHGDPNGAMRSRLDALEIGIDLPRGGDSEKKFVGESVQVLVKHDIGSVIDKLNAQQARTAAQRMENLLMQQVSFADTVAVDKQERQLALLEAFKKPSWRKDLAFTVSLMAGSDSAGMLSRIVRQDKQLRDFVQVPAAITSMKRQIMKSYSLHLDRYIAHLRLPYTAEPPLPDVFPIQPVGCKKWYVNDERIRGLLCEADNGFFTLSLALRAYNLEHGGYPDKLNRLVPSYLKKLPIEPFTMQETFCYKRTTSGYLLYSIGPDGRDDGGKPIINRKGKPLPWYFVDKDNKGDWVWGVNGCSHVINKESKVKKVSDKI